MSFGAADPHAPSRSSRRCVDEAVAGRVDRFLTNVPRSANPPNRGDNMPEFDIPEQSSRSPEESSSEPVFRPGAGPDHPLRVQVHRPGTGVLVLSAGGTLDTATTADFAELVRHRLECTASGLVLDLAHIEFIDTDGIITLLETATRAQARGVELVLVPGPSVTRLLELLEVGDRFVREDSAEHAVSNAQAAVRGRSR
ncbi:STAS domain-containing protein [Actinopolyspora sp. BKK1]|nr:STAS domain-containing protein [Actinopolyspora sp. BKK2]NHE74961.1 STAS domain-containing protein [Actinopolyspora sp. BKK1]